MMKFVLLILLVILTKFSLRQACFAKEIKKPQGDPQASESVFTPEGILPAGVDSIISTNPYTGHSGHARKGTVAATLNNIVLLNGLLAEKASAKEHLEAKKIIESIVALMPSLQYIGVFDLFSPEEWIHTKSQPGRILVGVLYLQAYPQYMTPGIKEQLMQIQQQTKIKELSEAIKRLLGQSA